MVTDKVHSPDLDDQSGVIRLVLIGTWCLVPVSPAVAMAVGNPVLPILVTAIVFALLGTIGSRWPGLIAKLSVSQGMIGQAIVFTAAFAGHAWQIDSHMVFFAMLATLMVLADPIVVLVAAGIIALHHISLGVFMPQLVYPSVSFAENLQRTAIHGTIVAIEAGVLFWAIRSRNRSAAEARSARHLAETSSIASRAARSDAEEAQKRAEEALSRAQTAQIEAEASKENALAEAARAQAADRRAREQEQADRSEREAAKKVQDDVVHALRGGLAALSRGDLSRSLNEPFAAEYEDLRHDFNASLGALNEALSNVWDAADQIGTETNSIATSADGLSRRSEAQAASLEQVSATAESMVAQVRRTASDASTARDIADQTRGRADESAALVVEAVDVMKRIAESSSRIQNIITVIDEIAFQTNLLALNAGVEAARAGDAGRGFAVVASEVRALAQRSSDAAKEIRGLIEASGRQVAEGVEVVDGTGRALGDVSSSVTEIAKQIASIAHIAQEQAAGLTEINAALSDLVSTNHRDKGALQETSASSQVLKRRAAELAGALEVFEMASGGTAVPVFRTHSQDKVA